MAWFTIFGWVFFWRAGRLHNQWLENVHALHVGRCSNLMDRKRLIYRGFPNSHPSQFGMTGGAGWCVFFWSFQMGSFHHHHLNHHIWDPRIPMEFLGANSSPISTARSWICHGRWIFRSVLSGLPSEIKQQPLETEETKRGVLSHYGSMGLVYCK